MTTAVTMSPPPDTALQVAFTSQGLAELGVPEAAIAGFSDEFRTGMAAEPSRSRRLGDVRANAPAEWAWGGTEERTPHLLVMLFAREGKLEAWERNVTGRGWARAFAPLTRLSTLDIGPIEPFGFADGISQPQIDWNCELALDGRAQLEFGNVLALGEVLLGYRNEYGQLTERPVLDPAFDAAAEHLPPALDARHRRDLGRNGSYLVFRQLEQDVPGFWRFVDEQAGHDEQRRRALADAMVGRRRDGTPLIPPTSKLIAGIASNRREHETNGFLYDDDPDGIRCPFGAHIRRANPRTGGPAGRRPAALAAPSAHAGLQALGLSRRHGVGDPLPPAGPPRPHLRVGALARGGPGARRPKRRSRAGCTSSASAPTSRASSSSCRTPG